ncbi:DUF6264 family protein [Luethyella okanaganae]|uniref:DUF6264 family protein n=1 Tax=Luethyella okanaganae TaxID=69372 RepID=A0ABW1VDK0_9MICO
MAETPAEPSEPAEATGDQRPRPRFGELAPEGWAWRPPVDPTTAGGSGVAGRPSPPPGPSSSLKTSLPDGFRKPREIPRWDARLTIVLMVIGLFGLTLAISTQAALPEAIGLLHTQEGLDDYTPTAAVDGIIVAGGIAQAALWVGSVAASITLMLRRKRAFWVPLTAGVLSMIVLLIVAGFVAGTDPALIDFYSNIGGRSR